jgi:hypothetical protein
MIKVYSHLKLLPASMLDIRKVFEHIEILFWGIRKQPQTGITMLLVSDFGVLGHLLSQNDVITSWFIIPKVYFFPGEAIEYQTHYLQHT